MSSIEETAAEMNVLRKGKNTLQQTMSSLQSIKYFLDAFKRNGTQSNNNLNFTGQHTDIAFASNDGGLPKSEIDKITDGKMKELVKDTYKEAVNDGYLNLDNGIYTLTDKGNEHINSTAFKDQFERDQKRTLTQDKAQITLTGNQSDLNVFRYVNEVNLHKLSNKDPVAFKKVISYLEKCEKYDFVNISSEGIVTPTEKCKLYLSQNKKFDFSITKITPDNVADLANVAKQATNNAVKESSKAVAKTTTKATAKTATKVAAKAGASAAAGAATAGVGTAVTAVVDLSKAGIKAISNSTQLHTAKSQKH